MKFNWITKLVPIALLTVGVASLSFAQGAGPTGGKLGPARAQKGGQHPILDALAKLNLTADQRQRIEGLERAYALKRKVLEAEMRVANVELAQAYQESHAYTPKVQASIDRIHRAMDALQTETMLHVIAMRGVLGPAQAAQFDDTVVRSLTAEKS